MVTTFSSLPPEIVLLILSHLPRPSINSPWAEYGDQLSPLATTSLVSKQFRTFSQQFLFESTVMLNKAQLQQWAATEASKATVELSIRLDDSDLTTENEDLAWLERTIRTGLANKESGGGKRLKVLALFWRHRQPLPGTICRLEGLSDLESIVTCARLPDVSFDHLRHLHLYSVVNLSLPNATFPSLTHLTIQAVPHQTSNWSIKFPSLCYLRINQLAGTGADFFNLADLRKLVLASVAHFATGSALDSDLANALPDWQSEIAILRRAGCKVTVRRRNFREWRGE